MSQEQDEIYRLQARVAELEARNAEWETFRAMFSDLSYHHQGMGCGIEDRGIHDRYQSSEHGWDCAMERVAELIPEEVESTPAPDVVTVPREELAVLRDGFGLLRTAWNLSLCDERIGSQAGALIEQHDALRSGEGGKNTTTNGAENG